MKNNHNVKLYKNISISFFRKCIAVLHFVSFRFVSFFLALLLYVRKQARNINKKIITTEEQAKKMYKKERKK